MAGSARTLLAPLQVRTTPIGQLVDYRNGQTLYTYKDGTATTSACTTEWCMQDWPPLLVQRAPNTVLGITGHLGVIRRPDGTLQLSLASFSTIETSRMG